MNMSGHFPGPPYMPPGPYFGPPPEFFGPTNRQEFFEPPGPPPFHHDQPNQQQFAEYSLWGNTSYRLDPTELIHPMFTQYNQFPCQPSPVPPYQAPELPDELPMPPQTVQDDLPKPEDKDDETNGIEESESTGLEEPEKHVIDRDDLFKHPDNYYFDIDGSSSNLDTVELASNSSGSSTGADWTNNHFQRAGAIPTSSAYPWNSRPSRVVHNRGRKANLMQRRLVKALSQPVKIDKGASMMQRMGWMGGGLGREENGTIDPIAPNAIYATTMVGFGQEVEQISHLPPRRANRVPCVRKQRNKKLNKEHFKTNVLLHLLEFVKSDLEIELYFDAKLKSNERKRIHRLVAAISGSEDGEELDTNQQQEIVNDIHRRNNYVLSTQSEGDGLARQICVFKEAPSHMFLVTPDDCRPCITEITEVEEDSNPFLLSIARHIRVDEGSALQPRPPRLVDRLAQYFIDFAKDAYTEFRFLGPFSKKEISVINNFFVLISDLSKKRKPYFKCPIELLDVFATDRVYTVSLDANGFTSIKKERLSIVEEIKTDQKKT